jgi:hypothetical protein
MATAALLLSIAGLSGCLPSAPEEAADPPPAASEVEMPDLTMTKVDDSGRMLAEMGLEVVVVRPEFVVECGPATTKQGTSFVVEEYVRPFEPDAWDHWVTGQDPAPGTLVATGASVTVTAGEHLGGAPGEKWLTVHGKVTEKHGDKECFESCHEKKHCTDCHEEAGVKEEKAPKP